MDTEKMSLSVPTGNYTLVDSNRLLELEQVSEIASIFGIFPKMDITLSLIFNIYCTRHNLTHSAINQKCGTSRTTLKKIASGQQPIIQEKTLEKLVSVLGQDFERAVKSRKFVNKDDESSNTD